MFTISDPDALGVVTIHASGAISREDYDRALPGLEALLDQHGRLRFLIDIVGVTSWSIGAMWEDLKFDLRRRKQIGRTAIVGDRRWQEWAVRVSSHLFDAEMRFFAPSHVDEARAWVEAGEA